jgi:hypothetical protein
MSEGYTHFFEFVLPKNQYCDASMSSYTASWNEDISPAQRLNQLRRVEMARHCKKDDGAIRSSGSASWDAMLSRHEFSLIPTSKASKKKESHSKKVRNSSERLGKSSTGHRDQTRARNDSGKAKKETPASVDAKSFYDRFIAGVSARGNEKPREPVSYVDAARQPLVNAYQPPVHATLPAMYLHDHEHKVSPALSHYGRENTNNTPSIAVRAHAVADACTKAAAATASSSSSSNPCFPPRWLKPNLSEYAEQSSMMFPLSHSHSDSAGALNAPERKTIAIPPFTAHSLVDHSRDESAATAVVHEHQSDHVLAETLSDYAEQLSEKRILLQRVAELQRATGESLNKITEISQLELTPVDTIAVSNACVGTAATATKPVDASVRTTVAASAQLGTDKSVVAPSAGETSVTASLVADESVEDEAPLVIEKNVAAQFASKEIAGASLVADESVVALSATKTSADVELVAGKPVVASSATKASVGVTDEPVVAQPAPKTPVDTVPAATELVEVRLDADPLKNATLISTATLDTESGASTRQVAPPTTSSSVSQVNSVSSASQQQLSAPHALPPVVVAVESNQSTIEASAGVQESGHVDDSPLDTMTKRVEEKHDSVTVPSDQIENGSRIDASARGCSPTTREAVNEEGGPARHPPARSEEVISIADALHPWASPRLQVPIERHIPAATKELSSFPQLTPSKACIASPSPSPASALLNDQLQAAINARAAAEASFLATLATIREQINQ